MRGVFCEQGESGAAGAAQSWAFLGKGCFWPTRPAPARCSSRPGFPHGVGAVVFQAAGCLFNPAAARSGEKESRFLPEKILAFPGKVSTMRGSTYHQIGKTQQYGIILRQVPQPAAPGPGGRPGRPFPGNCGSGGLRQSQGRPGYRGAAGRIFIQVCPDGPAPSPAPRRRSRRLAEKISNQNFVLHQKALLPQKFYAHGSANRAAVQRKYKLTLCQQFALYHNADTVSTIPAGRGTAGRMPLFCPPAQTQNNSLTFIWYNKPHLRRVCRFWCRVCRRSRAGALLQGRRALMFQILVVEDDRALNRYRLRVPEQQRVHRHRLPERQ